MNTKKHNNKFIKHYVGKPLEHFFRNRLYMAYLVIHECNNENWIMNTIIFVSIHREHSKKSSLLSCRFYFIYRFFCRIFSRPGSVVWLGNLRNFYRFWEISRRLCHHMYVCNVTKGIARLKGSIASPVCSNYRRKKLHICI